jgi:hypothetical protein
MKKSEAKNLVALSLLRCHPKKGVAQENGPMTGVPVKKSAQWRLFQNNPFQEATKHLYLSSTLNFLDYETQKELNNVTNIS